MFHEQPPVQFTPCVERTTLSCWKRLRYMSSQPRPRGLTMSLIQLIGNLRWNGGIHPS